MAIRAKLEYAAGQEAKAITDLEAAISTDEESPHDIFYNGGVKPGDDPSSTCMWTEADLDGLVKSFPAEYRVYFFRGLFYSFFATYDEPSIPKAQEDLQRAIQLNKSSGPLHFYLANFKPALAARAELYFQAKQYANTISDYGRLLELDPDNTTALHDQALAKLETGENYGAPPTFWNNDKRS